MHLLMFCMSESCCTSKNKIYNYDGSHPTEQNLTYSNYFFFYFCYLKVKFYDGRLIYMFLMYKYEVQPSTGLKVLLLTGAADNQ